MFLLKKYTNVSVNLVIDGCDHSFVTIRRQRSALNVLNVSFRSDC